MNTKKWIDTIVNETESALTLLYSYTGFHEALKDSKVVAAANRNREFWRVHTASLQFTLFVYLGRLTDSKQDCKSFPNFNAHCIKNVSDFTRESFLSRRGEALRMNPNFLDGRIFPTEQNIRDLFAITRQHKKNLIAECKTIRNKVYAHAIATEDFEYDYLFKKVELERIELALLALWSVSQHLLESYRNARTINPEVLSFSRKDEIYDAALKVITGNLEKNNVATFE